MHSRCSTCNTWTPPIFERFILFLNWFSLYFMDSTLTWLIRQIFYTFTHLYWNESSCFWIDLVCITWIRPLLDWFDKYFVHSPCLCLIQPVLDHLTCIWSVQPAIHGFHLYWNESSCFWIDFVCISWIRPLLAWFDKYFVHNTLIPPIFDPFTQYSMIDKTTCTWLIWPVLDWFDKHLMDASCICLI